MDDVVLRIAVFVVVGLVSGYLSGLFGIGGGWAQPSNSALRDQYIFEAFYRFQLTTQLAITPDVQWILHPTLNPNVGSIWVASLRARVTF